MSALGNIWKEERKEFFFLRHRHVKKADGVAEILIKKKSLKNELPP